MKKMYIICLVFGLGLVLLLINTRNLQRRITKIELDKLEVSMQLDILIKEKSQLLLELNKCKEEKELIKELNKMKD